ncbi:CCA-adding enzyme / 2'-nucleotidase / 2',3'-cyclic phosphodiesterase / Phosphatase [Rubrivivax sp. A210]|uniref:multifunctional CCA addition/repair protein n=1 Tax=Rubrivivax sp. A210 TaxID=2772301 RepID=UPI001918CB3F|nr:multifunctional CCA addition/repair protein [Rubrivivax sp. A210]CAD5374194.1 CCA-adding enzyme / 2'-nucleotidase / 2',3'-cyclic phosphodiesterase / Phosphatase [Rubrivivax sp. A210]
MTAGPRRYIVGGAVRDALLGLPAADRDWVVVGATPEDLIAQGLRPVGKDFPVFIDPATGEEVALARTERKTAPGYHGFSFHAAPEVTLEQDLARRDLTINAIAQAEDGTLVDPYGGRRDLGARVLRHVSEAFVEDPVRLLRLARLAARFFDFTVAPETMALLRRMVADGEVDALVPERVWQELSRGLMAARPGRMFELLRECGALARLLPEVDRLWGVPQPPEHHPEIDTGAHLMLVLDGCARLQAPLAARWACLVHDLGKGTTPADQWPRHLGHEQRSAKLARSLAERLRVPTDCRELAEVVAREHGNVHASGSLGAPALLRLLERCDAWRRPQRFAEMLLACECDARGRAGLQDRPYPQRERLAEALRLTQAADVAGAAQAALARGEEGPAIGRAVNAARVEALKNLDSGR